MSKKRYNLLDFINENIGKYILLGPHIFRVDCIQGVDDYAVSERDRNQKVLSVFFSNLTNLERTPDPMRTAYFLEDILDLVRLKVKKKVYIPEGRKFVDLYDVESNRYNSFTQRFNFELEKIFQEEGDEA